MKMLHSVTIRDMADTDPCPMSLAFAEQGWDKTEAQFQQYLREQRSGARDVLIAEHTGQFAGYVTIVWKSDYPPFRDSGFPEVVDLNVLIRDRRHGIGSALLDAAEARIAKRSSAAGIGVGLTADYGPAHILYVKRGYIPDGRGLYQDGKHCQYGDRPTVNDDLTLYFTKRLAPKDIA